MILDRAIEAVARARAPKEPPVPVGAEVIADSLFERPPCPACGNTRGDVLLIGADDWTGANHGGQAFAVVRCAICAHRYTSPRYKREHRAMAFAGAYPFYSRAKAARAGRSGDLEAARHPFEGRAARVCDRHPTPGRLLDVGGGDGLFGDVMRRRGWDVVTIDTDDDVLWHAREVLGLCAERVDLETDPLPNGPFDAVTLWGVLQLAYDPRALLGKVLEVCAPGAVVAAGVSNVRSFGARMFGTRWRGLGLPRHLSHFTPESLRRVFEWSGLSVLGLEYDTPRWIVAGSVDAALPVLRRPTKALLYGAGQLLGRTRAADTMEIYGRARLAT